MDRLSSSRSGLLRHAEHALPLLYAAWMIFFSGALQAFELNTDEGVNLIKAWLVVQGHPLYDAIWSDQPPLFTYTLAGLLHLAGPTVLLPRLLMILAGAVFLAGIGRHLRATAALPHALAAQTLILSQPAFYVISPAVMVGLPAIYLATAAALVALRDRSSSNPALPAISALLFALSMMTKVFTAVLAPALLVLLVWPSNPDHRPRWRRTALWAGLVAFFLAGLGFLLVGRENLGQLFGSHWHARLTDNTPWLQQTLSRHLRRVPWIPWLAAAGSILALFRRCPSLLLFAAWTCAAGIALAFHAPVWMHQQLLFTLPAAVIGGYGLGEFLTVLARHRPASWPARPDIAHGALLATAMLVVALSWQRIGNAPGLLRVTLSNQVLEVREVVDALAHPEDRDRPIITDRPMFAFRAGRTVPAWTAALTQKRLFTGDISANEFLDDIIYQEPALVVLARFSLPEVRTHLDQHALLLVSNNLAVVFAPHPSPESRDDAAAMQHRWQAVLHRPRRWYGSGEARSMAGQVAASQGPHGGWAKQPPPAEPDIPAAPDGVAGRESLDNQSTLSQVRFLARVIEEQPRPDLLAAWRRGVDFLLASQHACGAWPQSYPRRVNPYNLYATLNDRVSTDAARLLDELLHGPLAHLLTIRQTQRMGDALDRLQNFLVRSQFAAGGELTGWAQQYDPDSLQPRPARTFEPVALASRETADVLAYLMKIEKPSPEVRQAVNAGARWLQTVTLRGIRLVDRPDSSLPHGRDREVVHDPNAPPIWARFYDVNNMRPIFAGRDGLLHATLAEVEPERRAGYDFYTQEPATVLNDLYPAWLRRQDM